MTEINHNEDSGNIGACPHDCSDNCSMIRESHNEQLLSVRGNAEHPCTGSGLCVKVAHYEVRAH